MIGYLQCQGCFSERLVIGPNEDQLQTATISDVEGLPLVGHFTKSEFDRILFYLWGNVLRIRIGAAAPLILKEVKTDWTLIDNTVEFRIKHNNETVVVLRYPASRELATLDDNPTPFVEAEDYDFFLFVHNVLSDQSRANRIYRPEFKDSP